MQFSSCEKVSSSSLALPCWTLCAGLKPGFSHPGRKGTPSSIPASAYLYKTGLITPHMLLAGFRPPFPDPHTTQMYLRSLLLPAAATVSRAIGSQGFVFAAGTARVQRFRAHRLLFSSAFSGRPSSAASKSQQQQQHTSTSFIK